MTVNELIDRLKCFAGDAIVVMAKDREGNGYSPLELVEDGTYVPENTWSGELHSPHENTGPYAVGLWPVN